MAIPTPPHRVIIILLLVGFASNLDPVSAQNQEPVGGRLSQGDIDHWMTELSNWGRWGKNDQLGALNLLSPAKVQKATKLVKQGISISLAHEAITEKAVDNPSPFIHQMDRTGLDSDGGASDTYSVSYHGLVHTHMDALCHFFYHGKMFNGYPKEEVTATGARQLGVERLKNGIMARAILMDIPRLRGVEFLEPGEAIFPADLEAWEKKARVKITSGDVVLIRTGRWARRAVKGPSDPSRVAGLDASCAPWLKKRDIAVLGSDACSDVVPSGIKGVDMPIHQLMLGAMGVVILDNCDLEMLGQKADRFQSWEFLLTVAPLAVTGGTGSPINPVATF